MREFSNNIRQTFGVEVDLDDAAWRTQFKRRAVYVSSLDFVEYVSSDETLVSDRVDHFLTLHWNGDQSDVIGFKLKGFRHHFENELKPMFSDADFIPLVLALERELTAIGKRILPRNIEDDRVASGYAKAKALAERDDVLLEERSLHAA